jgi:hypothetical protein
LLARKKSARLSALLGADRCAVQLEGRGDVELLADHEALAVIIVDAREVQAERRVARHRPGGVADEHVHFAGLERREAVLGGQRHELHLGRVVEDGRGDCAADIDVEAGPHALVIGYAEAGEPGVGAALKEALLLHGVERAGGCGARYERGGRAGRQCHEEFFHQEIVSHSVSLSLDREGLGQSCLIF